MGKLVKSKSFRFPEMPFVLLQSKKSRFAVALSVFLFVWFFLFIFGVFNFDNYDWQERLIMTFVYSLACFLVVLFNFLILQERFFKTFTYVNIFLWSGWLTFTVGISNFLITTQVYQINDFTLEYFMVNQSYVFRVFVIIFPAVLIINYLFHIRNQLQQMRLESEKLDYHKTELDPSCRIEIKSKYKSNSIVIDISDILFIKSAGNYIRVHSISASSNGNNLVRTTLASIEKQKLHPCLVRCHRGYIVNTDKVDMFKKIDGQDFLLLKDHTRIPVSKKYKVLVQKILDSRI